MVRQSTNTSRFPLFPEGIYTFTIVEKPEKRRSSSGKSTYRIWKLRPEGFRDLGDLKIIILPWLSRELLLAVGGEDKGNNVVDWDDDEVIGKKIIAEVVHVTDDQGNTRERLENIKPVVDRQKPDKSMNEVLDEEIPF